MKLQQLFKSNPTLLALIATMTLCYVYFWSTPTSPLLKAIYFNPAAPTLLNILFYPWAHSGPGVIYFILGMLWLYWMGGQVERETSSLTALIFFFASSILGVAILPAFPNSLAITGEFIASAAFTAAVATRHPLQQVLLMGIIPIQLRWLAIGTTLALVFLYGFGTPLAGIATAIPCILAYLWAANKLPLKYSASTQSARNVSKKEVKKDKEEFNKFIDDVRTREEKREENERLRKLFESSLNDDPPEK